jgi:hypothetical protein
MIVVVGVAGFVVVVLAYLQGYLAGRRRQEVLTPRKR